MRYIEYLITHNDEVGRWNRTILLLCLVLNYKQTSTTYILVQEANTLYLKKIVFEPQKCLLPLAINHDGMEYFMTRGAQETLGYQNILMARVKKPGQLVNILPPNQGNNSEKPHLLNHCHRNNAYIHKPGFKVPCTYT